MIKFSQYIAEAKLTHLEHLEDAIFNDGYNGGVEALKILKGVITTLQGNTSKGLNITSKVDGAPSIVAGINPENGKFFVATKALFNKTPKINYTNADVDANHGHAAALADKMKLALKTFPQLGIKGIWQGDFMFTASEIKKETIDGEKMITFTPNTITYAVPIDQPLAKEISSKKVGVIWHTQYTGKTIADLSAVFNVNVGSLKKSKDVWAGDVNFQDVSGTATLTKPELKAVNQSIANAEARLKKFSKKAMKVLFDPATAKQEGSIAFNLNIYINALTRDGKGFVNKQKAVGGFIDFMRKRYQPKIDKLKSAKGKAKQQAELDKMIKTINGNRQMGANLAYAIEWHNDVAEIKLALIKKMEQVSSLPAFIKKGNGYEVTGPEGFVAVDHATNGAVKFVNRLEFSRNNFNAIKNWGGK